MKTFNDYLEEQGGKITKSSMKPAMSNKQKQSATKIGNQNVEKEKEEPDREITHEVHPIDSKSASNLHKAMKASGYRAEKIESVHHKEHGDLNEITYAHPSNSNKITVHTK